MNEEEIKKKVKEIADSINVEERAAKDKNEKSRIKKDRYKKYDEIYELYGSKAYCKYVPRKFRKQDIKQLLKEKRYISIYNKHGENEFNNYLEAIKGNDIEYETGSKLKKVMYKMKNFFKTGVFTTTAAIATIVPLAIDEENQRQEKEMIDYRAQIVTYLKDIEEYGQNIQKQEFTDLQNVMYVMDDMWNGILGYRSPDIDLKVCPGLDLADSNGYGVCRNMADDFARKLNAINENYEARVIQVYVERGNYELAEIDTKMYRLEGEVDETPQEKTTLNQIITSVFGNHAVTIFKSLEDDGVELVADPTNPGIGMFINGSIYMFNSKGENPVEFKYRPLASIVYGSDKVAEVPKNYIDGIGIYSKEKISYLEEKYGVEQQNKALKYTRAAKPVSFYDTVKISPDVIDNKDKETHIEEIQNGSKDIDEKNNTEKQENDEVIR